jgi:hypothetical protein
VTRFDRIALVVLAAVTPTWRNVLRIVQPETLLRWHRAGFKALWRWRSRPAPMGRDWPCRLVKKGRDSGGPAVVLRVYSALLSTTDTRDGVAALASDATCVRRTRTLGPHLLWGNDVPNDDAAPSPAWRSRLGAVGISCRVRRSRLSAAYDPPLVADAVNVSRTVVTTDLLRGNTASRSASATQALAAGSRGLLLASLATTLMRRPS